MPAPSGAGARYRWSFDAIGTAWQIDTGTPLEEGVRDRVRGVIDRFDREWSRFRPDSLVAALARGAAEVPAPPDTDDMMDAFAALERATDRAVTPLIGASLEARGYDSAYGFSDRGALPAPAHWQERLSWRDGTLRLSEPALIDVGALGKGRLVDLVLAEVLPAAGGEAVVDAGGDSAMRGAPQRIALEHPYDPRRAIGVMSVTDAALCASATNRRAWGDGLHHVLDGRTGEPVRTIAATWATAATAMRADALATALFFDGGPELAARWDAQWVRMTTDGRVQWSPRSTAELFV